MSRFPVDGISVEEGGSFAFSADCPNCANLLDLHQPDPQLPDRLLGICPRCKTWFLIDIEVGGEFVVSTLPEHPE